MYKVKINDLGFELLMPHRRLPKYLAFLYVMLQPFRELYSAFIEYRKELNYELAITAEVFSLEHYLNGLFFETNYLLADRQTSINSKSIISIEDTSHLPYAWLGENEDFLLGESDGVKDADGFEDPDAVFLADSEAYELHNHFIVRVPAVIMNDYGTIVLREEVNKFNHVNRKFTIEEYPL